MYKSILSVIALLLLNSCNPFNTLFSDRTELLDTRPVLFCVYQKDLIQEAAKVPEKYIEIEILKKYAFEHYENRYIFRFHKLIVKNKKGIINLYASGVSENGENYVYEREMFLPFTGIQEVDADSIYTLIVLGE